LQIAPAGAVAKFERHFLHPRLLFPYIGRRDQKKRYYQSERTTGRLSLVSHRRRRCRRLRRRDTSLVREHASDRCELRRRGLCKREWFLSTGREIDRENRHVASGWMMTVTVPGGGDGGGRVLLLVITTFVASTARGAGRSLFRGSLVPKEL